MLRSLLLCALLLPLMGCGDDSPGQGNPDNGDPTKVTYAESLNVDLSTMTLLPTGLYLQDLGAAGTGAEATDGARVQVHYTGWLPDGTKFESSENKAPIGFNVGRRQVIDGWDQGILGMRVGGKRRLIIPSSLGYGSQGSSSGRIPPYTVLIFEVELISVR
ncbi:FKBP-type peptidylprolyl cis-trans isomerase [Myxococcus stipitatus DSM 14675]|uniref:Peptidyl-prolyl cis-trans isomerase n=1 Tax=Myxococcus stipitatus (strain DSM 14675 / JCM 12634 / Mx s8) TaxID=1278073 RepID=L7U8A2_MYXSD|nr:FKBP-type peptidyl-prolyl cis-trans isomerase [Myxococcus stipitatus]AGC45146.1 FKBP-type peptidylprolyl cis-trans isomerase [Myxococcus stipitatus DSM 14675]